jgi:uncharacterized RDD family membrane protein YckC
MWDNWRLTSSGFLQTRAMNQTSDPKIDCVVRVVTPENIEFEYLLAGPFQRLPAFLVDFFLRAAIFLAAVMTGVLIGLPLSGGLGVMMTAVLGLLSFFVLSWLYGTLMETHFNGRTVGKMLLGLRVISSDGRPINGSQAALRNLLRLSDFMPPLSLTLFYPDAPPADVIPTFFVGLLTMTLTSRMQRLGDLAAGTMVVWDGRRGFNMNLQPEDARAYALAELIPPTFQISRTLARNVALYMERRRFLSPLRREEIASNLAQPLCALFELLPDTSSDLLLCAMYVRIYHSEQQRAARLAAIRAVQGAQPTATAPLGWPTAPRAPQARPTQFQSSQPQLPVILAETIQAESLPQSASDRAPLPSGSPVAGQHSREEGSEP